MRLSHKLHDEDGPLKAYYIEYTLLVYNDQSNMNTFNPQSGDITIDALMEV